MYKLGHLKCVTFNTNFFLQCIRAKILIIVYDKAFGERENNFRMPKLIVADVKKFPMGQFNLR